MHTTSNFSMIMVDPLSQSTVNRRSIIIHIIRLWFLAGGTKSNINNTAKLSARSRFVSRSPVTLLSFSAYQSARPSFLLSFLVSLSLSFFTLPPTYPFNFFRAARRCTARYPTAKLLRSTREVHPKDLIRKKRYAVPGGSRGEGWPEGRGVGPLVLVRSRGWPREAPGPPHPKRYEKNLATP